MGIKKSKTRLKILITAGPTWVPIDAVRVISNTATGKTGVMLAESLRRKGACVTLLLGPGQACCIEPQIKVKRFTFFDDLKKLLEKELRQKSYDILVHTAAVSDYTVSSPSNAKLPSGKHNMHVRLSPTPKLINTAKQQHASLFLVGFKYEVGCTARMLVQRARTLMRTSRADVVVANTQSRTGYSAYILNAQGVSGKITSKKALIHRLTKLIIQSCQP